MNDRILILNAGSSSLKYALFDSHLGVLTRGSLDLLRSGNHARALLAIRKKLKTLGESADRIALVGHRIVHGGDFHTAKRLTPTVLRTLQKYVSLAPLHQAVDLQVVELSKKLFLKAGQAAAFDTAYFADLPAEASTYAIPPALTKKYRIQRYGFHGLSHAWAAEQASNILKKPIRQLKLVTLHLGSGASAAAIDRGKPIETSMGLTPLEGLVMATRPGDLDPGIPLFLAEHGWSAKKVDRLLNRESGWFGLTGMRDFRDVLLAAGMAVPGWKTKKASKRQHLGAGLAVDLVVHRIVKYVGAYHALLGGADALVFTGAIGERSAALRRVIEGWAKPIGIQKSLVVKADEEKLIAREVRRFVN